MENTLPLSQHMKDYDPTHKNTFWESLVQIWEVLKETYWFMGIQEIIERAQGFLKGILVADNPYDEVAY